METFARVTCATTSVAPVFVTETSSTIVAREENCSSLVCLDLFASLVHLQRTLRTVVRYVHKSRRLLQRLAGQALAFWLVFVLVMVANRQGLWEEGLGSRPISNAVANWTWFVTRE